MTGSRIKRNCLGEAPGFIKMYATCYITLSSLPSFGPGKKEPSLVYTHSSIQVVYRL